LGFERDLIFFLHPLRVNNPVLNPWNPTGLKNLKRKMGMHSKPEIEPEYTKMTEPEPSVEQDEFLMQGGEYLVGGIELHARIVEEGKKPGVDFTFMPTIHNHELPELVTKFNQELEHLCRVTVANFSDPRSLGRFYREVKKDGSKRRCWYRVTVTTRVDSDDQLKERISDVIDPALLRADPHVKFRARQLRAMLQRCLHVDED
jgi:hypothetical protein